MPGARLTLPEQRERERARERAREKAKGERVVVVYLKPYLVMG